jgi:hypothetical protein
MSDKPKQMRVKQEKGEYKKEFKVENSARGSVAGAGVEKGVKPHDTYMTLGATRHMHGKAKGGHPTKRAEEMK